MVFRVRRIDSRLSLTFASGTGTEPHRACGTLKLNDETDDALRVRDVNRSEDPHLRRGYEEVQLRRLPGVRAPRQVR